MPLKVERNAIAVIDLFAGAGGFSVAASLAGHSVPLSVEMDEVCCTTIYENRRHTGHAVECADVLDITGADLRKLGRLSRTDPLIVVGGPPCQPFSKASYWTDPGDDSRYRRARARGHITMRPSAIVKAKPDERRDLLAEFQRLVVEARADGFVMENVASLLHPRNVKMFNRIVAGFERAGYRCNVVEASALHYGVPQKRSRIFVLGSRSSKPKSPAMKFRAADTSSGELPYVPSLASVLAPFSGAEFYEEGEVVEGRWAEHLRSVPPGWNYKHLTAWAGHPKPVFEAETRFWNFLLKLAPDQPSWTINANPGPWVGPFHWDSRRLRTPELAVIQSFPSNYIFHGNRRARVRQLGNAVPPLLASPMIESVANSIGGV
jgi:DNA (cytosine-5)-methyltransferase 1